MDMPPLTISRLKEQYATGRLKPSELLDRIQQRIAVVDNPGIWIRPLEDAELRPFLERLEGADPGSMPLYGIPFAIKDNIDLAHIPTTAGCPDFSYTPSASSPVVHKLLEAGAVPVGKTNLDQFATGLVGTRTPYTLPRNPLASDRVPGGSSSGSAVALSEGLVSFSLGSDTAGSGRVPAAFNNIWGLKPSRGRLSTIGLVPACRTLDCISIFALNGGDCRSILDVVEGYDPEDPFSREFENIRSAPGRLGIPRARDLMFFGDAGYPSAWERSVASLQESGWEIVEIDFSPYLEAARLLYEGPWVAERYAAIESFIRSHSNSIYPVTRKIIGSGIEHSAKSAFHAIYKLASLKRQTENAFEDITAIVTPTVGGFPTLSEVDSDPIVPNSNLGYYTNFMNLLDLCAVAVPAGFTDGGLPFGITWIGPKDSDHQLLEAVSTGPRAIADQTRCISLILFGAHMNGLPFNPSVRALGACFNRKVKTAPIYRMIHLYEPAPPRPGIIRVGPGGYSIEGEAWDFPLESLGEFLSQIHQPLGLGEIELEDGSCLHGFLCEGAAGKNAEDISESGGWRAFSRG